MSWLLGSSSTRWALSLSVVLGGCQDYGPNKSMVPTEPGLYIFKNKDAVTLYSLSESGQNNADQGVVTLNRAVFDRCGVSYIISDTSDRSRYGVIFPDGVREGCPFPDAAEYVLFEPGLSR